MLEIARVLLLELLILLWAIGLWRCFYGALNNQTIYNEEAPFYNRPPRRKPKILILSFLIGVIVVLYGHRWVTNSYYDYFTTGLLVGSLSLVWFTAIVIGMFALLFLPDGLAFEGKQGKLIWFILTITTATFVILLGPLVAIPSGIRTAQGIVNGPAFTEGIVQSKISGFDRAGANYYVTINNQGFDVPNGVWWNTLRRGDTITYAYNPHAEDGGAAFPPDEIGFTLPGVLIISISFFLLSVTIWAGIGGFTNRSTQQQIHYPAEKFPTYPHVDRRNLPKELREPPSSRTLNLPTLLIGATLFAVSLLFAWKKFYKRAQK